ncbi:MAG: TauD/TfdA family dioxygenase, partial [Bacteroidota bacterium]
LNRHSNGQKLTDTRLLDLEQKPNNIRLEGSQLFLRWGNTEIAYPLASLRSALIPLNSKLNFPAPVLWANKNSISSYNYSEVTEQPSILLACLQDIIIHGFTHLKDVPNESGTVLKLVELFGYVRETNFGKFYDVISKQDPENLADTGLALAPHTDNPYRKLTPTIQLLHCLQADTEGGETILMDGFFLAELLRFEQPYFFRLLSKYAVQFRYTTPIFDLFNEARVIELDFTGATFELDSHAAEVLGRDQLLVEQKIKSIKFNNRSIQPFQLSDATMLPFYQAYQHFEGLLHKEEYQLCFKLQAGEAIIYDNERVLHGRTAFQVAVNRHLQGCYADRDALLSKIRILSRK